MADEPILCFDGDGAGQRAAFRAVDLALPRLGRARASPSRACRTARTRRSRALRRRAAIADVLAGARPLAEMLWMRETAAGRFDTPERRAGLEARINAVTSGIGDESVRKYYRQDLRARLRSLFAPPARPASRGGAGRFARRARAPSAIVGAIASPASGARRFADGEPASLARSSPRLAASSSCAARAARCRPARR